MYFFLGLIFGREMVLPAAIHREGMPLLFNSTREARVVDRDVPEPERSWKPLTLDHNQLRQLKEKAKIL